MTLREFARTYGKRALILLPILAVITFIPPGPLWGKIAGVAAFFFLLLIAQLAEVLMVVHHAKEQRAADLAEHADLTDPAASAEGMTRKQRRIRSRMQRDDYI